MTPSCPPTPGWGHTHWEPDEMGPPGVEPLGVSRAWALFGEKGELGVTSCPTILAHPSNTSWRGQLTSGFGEAPKVLGSFPPPLSGGTSGPQRLGQR